MNSFWEWKMFWRLALVFICGSLLPGFNTKAFGEDNDYSGTKQNKTPSANPNELEGQKSGPVTFDFAQKYPDWYKDSQIVQNHISSFKSPASIKVDSFSNDIEILTRLWNDNRDTPCMKLIASMELLECWGILYQKYSSKKIKNNFEKWGKVFSGKWDSIKNSTEYTDETLDCLKANPLFNKMEGLFIAEYSKTPEGQRENELEGDKADLQDALNNWCDAMCDLKTWKKQLEYQKRIEKAGGVVNLEVDRMLGIKIVNDEDRLEKAKEQYREIAHKSPSLKNCQCENN